MSPRGSIDGMGARGVGLEQGGAVKNSVSGARARPGAHAAYFPTMEHPKEYAFLISRGWEQFQRGSRDRMGVESERRGDYIGKWKCCRWRKAGVLGEFTLAQALKKEGSYRLWHIG